MDIEIGDYISFWDNDDVLYKVLDIHRYYRNFRKDVFEIYILIKDDNNMAYWENISYVERVVKRESKSIE